VHKKIKVSFFFTYFGMFVGFVFWFFWWNKFWFFFLLCSSSSITDLLFEAWRIYSFLYLFLGTERLKVSFCFTYVGMFIGFFVIFFFVKQVLIFFLCYFLLLLHTSSRFSLFFLLFSINWSMSLYFCVLLFRVDERVFISVFGNIKLKVSYCLIQHNFQLLLIRLQDQFLFQVVCTLLLFFSSSSFFCH